MTMDSIARKFQERMKEFVKVKQLRKADIDETTGMMDALDKLVADYSIYYKG